MRICKQMCIYLLMIVMISLSTAGGAFFFNLHKDNARLLSRNYSIFPVPSAGQRVLIFAPHCDDETLGTGALVNESLAAGAKVHVVLMTNGDGFSMAAARQLHRVRLNSKDYIRFAEDRQLETLRALRVLGLKPSEVTFLGYPDKGLAPMWFQYWTADKLYRSRQTDCNHSPYVNSFHHNAPYYGLGVLADVKKIIKDQHPTDIFMPHPNEEHPDHWATNCYVNTALETLRQDKNFSNIRVHCYIVHRGDWPTPQGLHRNLPMVPPNALLNIGTYWRLLSVNPKIVNLKYEAIKRYSTQTAVMGRFLYSFARRSEIFGECPILTIPHVKPGTIHINGNTADWQRISPVVRDPVGDKLSRRVEGSGDIRAIYVAEDGNRLYIRAQMRKTLSSEVHYQIRLHAITDKPLEPEERNFIIAVRPPSRFIGPLGDFAWQQNELEISLPMSQFHSAHALYIGMETKFGGVLLDRSGWRLVRFYQKSSSKNSAK